jgi:rhodanese-related sulfurtransferase
VEISALEFLWKEKLLVAVAIVSGGMLLWPLARKSTGGPWVDPLQATQLINREDALVLDVREPGEFGAGHLLGAKNVPLSRLEALPGDVAKRKEKPVIVYCDGGERSAKALSALRKQGFTRVANLSGGLKAWQQAGLPVEK